MVKYPARFEKDDIKGYYIEFIDLPNAFTQGETMEELYEMAQDVLSLIINYRLEEGKDIPKPSNVEGDDIIYVAPYPEVILPLLIRNYRKKTGKPQSEIAKKMKIPYQTYQRWEKAKNFNPTLKTLKKVAKALGKKLIVDIV